MGEDEKVCDWIKIIESSGLFYCRNGSIFQQQYVQCNGKLDCADGEDEWFCDLKLSPPKATQLVEINVPFYPAELQNINIKPIYRAQSHNLLSSDAKSTWVCNRGTPVIDGKFRRCLCSPGYFGERCENQQERLSIILQIVSSSLLQRNIAIKLILYLVDITSLEILADEEVLHLPYIHSSYKHLITLSSARAQHSFVRIDCYEINIQRVIGYRASWKFSLSFPFLPVRHLAVRLDLPNDEHVSSKTKSMCNLCIHGQCLSYRNSDDVFCSCYHGWTGVACNETFHCATGAISLNSHRCLCPMDRYGTRCFIPNIAECRCLNGATCLPLDVRSKRSTCLCSGNYFGEYCEKQYANLTIRTFDRYQPKVLPIVLIQLIRITPYSNMLFENIFLFEHISTSHSLVIHHVNYEYLPSLIICKVFYSSSVDDYTYYIIFQIPYKIFSRFKLRHFETQLQTSQKCSDVRKMEMFRKPVNIIAYPYIKRIKYYLRACTEKDIRCFYDEIYMCFCSAQKNETAICNIYDHNREICKAPNYCLNEGLCVENRHKGIVKFICLCPSCHYYGALCQFSIGKQGLSLDGLLGITMHTGKALSEQPITIKMTMTFLIVMITFGLVGNILCIITFAQKTSRATGGGYYLFLMSIYNIMALILLGLRFTYFLVTQMAISNNRALSLILCQCLEFGLTIFPNLSNWLSVCVGIERTYIVAYGVLFNKQKSIRIAKLLCIVLLLVLTGLTVHEPMTRQLIEDPRLGRFTWCIKKYDSTKLQTLASILSIIQLVGPFLVNSLSMSILIVIISRKKLNLKKNNSDQSFVTVLYQQICYYKHFILSPAILLLLTLPRLIITLGSLCVDTSWRNYVFLSGYFISFIPFMATLFIFIIPSPTYRTDLILQVTRRNRR